MPAEEASLRERAGVAPKHLGLAVSRSATIRLMYEAIGRRPDGLYISVGQGRSEIAALLPHGHPLPQSQLETMPSPANDPSLLIVAPPIEPELAT